MMGAPGKRSFVFQTPGPDSNFVRGLPCDIKFSYKRPWLKEADSESDNKVVKVTVN